MAAEFIHLSEEESELSTEHLISVEKIFRPIADLICQQLKVKPEEVFSAKAQELGPYPHLIDAFIPMCRYAFRMNDREIMFCLDRDFKYIQRNTKFGILRIIDDQRLRAAMMEGWIIAQKMGYTEHLVRSASINNNDEEEDQTIVQRFVIFFDATRNRKNDIEKELAFLLKGPDLTTRGTPRVQRKKRSAKEAAEEPYAPMTVRVPSHLKERFNDFVASDKSLTKTSALEEALEDFLDKYESHCD
ncbi:MAG: hypothetical protein AAF221_07895 [Pseudomonadota bacterium]